MNKSVSFISIGTEVHDDLTGKSAKVIGVSYKEGKLPDTNCIGAIGYFLDNDYLGGARHPWELSELPKKPKRQCGFMEDGSEDMR